VVVRKNQKKRPDFLVTQPKWSHLPALFLHLASYSWPLVPRICRSSSVLPLRFESKVHRSVDRSHRCGSGSPFDLTELASQPLVLSGTPQGRYSQHSHRFAATHQSKLWWRSKGRSENRPSNLVLRSSSGFASPVARRPLVPYYRLQSPSPIGNETAQRIGRFRCATRRWALSGFRRLRLPAWRFSPRRFDRGRIATDCSLPASRTHCKL
jgi:hypothetical protein